MEFHSPEFVKANAMKRNNRLRNMALIMEFVVCSVLFLLLSWSTIRSPVMLEIFTSYLRELGSVFRINSYTVFIVCNLIIILVFVESSSSKMSGQQQAAKQTDLDYSGDSYSSPMSMYSPQPRLRTWTPPAGKGKTEQTKGLRTLDFSTRKLSVEEQIVKRMEPLENVAEQTERESVGVVPESAQLYRRTMSASYERGGVKVKNAESPAQRAPLKRSKTVKWRGSENSTGVPDQGFADLSHDEFRLKIESFIAKQQKMIREEYLVVGRSPSDIVSRRRL